MFIELLKQRRNPELHLVRRQFARTMFTWGTLLFLLMGIALNMLRNIVANSSGLQSGILADFTSYVAALSIDFFLMFLVVILCRFFSIQRGELFPQLELAGVTPAMQLTALFDLVLALMLVDVVTESLLLMVLEGTPIFSRSAEFITTVLFAFPFAFFFASLLLLFNLRRMLILWQVLIPAAIFAGTMLLVSALSDILMPQAGDLLEMPVPRALANYFDPRGGLARAPHWSAILVGSWALACAAMMPVAAICAIIVSHIVRRNAHRLTD